MSDRAIALALLLVPAVLAAQPTPPPPPAPPADRPVPMNQALAQQLARAQSDIHTCAGALPAKAVRPVAIRLVLLQRGDRPRLIVLDPGIKPARARAAFDACVRKAVADQARSPGNPADPNTYSSGPITVKLPGTLPVKDDPLGCMADADCELVCPTAGNCCGGMCGACTNALNHAGAVAARALAKTACKPRCVVDCAMKMQESRALCVEHRCTGKIMGRGGLDDL